MKYDKKNELDVDSMGGLGPLTAEEKKAINDYLIAKKSQTVKIPVVRKIRTAKREKLVAS